MKPTFLILVSVWLLFAPNVWPCTIVEGDRIVGSHMAAEVPAFATLAGDADIGPAPAPGARRVFQPFELERLAQKHSLHIPAGEACFERATQILSEEELMPLLQAEVGSDTSIEIIDYSKNALPLGQPQFPRAGLNSSGLWRGKLVFGENRSVPIWVRVRAVDAATGKAVTAARSSHEPAIERGDTVRVEVASGSVILAFDAAAESSGHPGEAIVIRNPSNGKRLRAIVEAKGKVVIRP